jgi:hypothetical protein
VHVKYRLTPITLEAPASAANKHRIPVPQPTSSPLLMKNNLWPIYDTDLLLITITDILFTSILVFYTKIGNPTKKKITDKGTITKTK